MNEEIKKIYEDGYSTVPEYIEKLQEWLDHPHSGYYFMTQMKQKEFEMPVKNILELICKNCNKKVLYIESPNRKEVKCKCGGINYL